MNFFKYTLLLSFFVLFSFSLFSADKNLVIQSLENNNSENFSKTKIYIKTRADKYSVKDKLLESGLKNIISIEKPFDNYIKNNLKFQSAYELNNIYLVEFKENISVIELCLELNSRDDIEYASPLYHRELHEYIPNDYDEENQYYLELIDAFDAFEISKGDTNILVGVVDSGFDINHDDLKDNIYINYAEIPDDGIDNDGNGFVDDYIGWDFVGDRNQQQLENEDFIEDNDVITRVSEVTHGTHVAGLISAVTDNDTGIASIGYKVKLLPVKCATDDLRVSRGVYKTNEALLYAYEMGADVINCSWGSNNSYDPVEHDIVKTIYEGGTLIVASAGNMSADITGLQYPADYPEVLTVGSIGENKQRSYFTSFGPNVDVYAPGGDVYSTDDNNAYSEKSGTSMSSPIVAGLAALLKSANPNMTPEQLKYRIKSASTVSEFNDDKHINAFNTLKMNNLPGMKLINLTLNGGDTLIFKNDNIVTADYINILASAGSFNYSLKSDKLNVSKYGLVKNVNDNYTITDEFIISDNYPFFEGTADIKIDLRATIDHFNYFEREEKRFPFRFKTNNKFLEQAQINAYYTFWTNAEILQDMTFWGSVFINNNMYLTRFGDTLNMDVIQNLYQRNLQATDKNTAFFTVKNQDREDSLSFYKVKYDDGDFNYQILLKYPYPVEHKYYMFRENHGIILNYNYQFELNEYKNGEIKKVSSFPDTLNINGINDIFLFYEHGRIGIYTTLLNSDDVYYIYSDDMMNTWTTEINQYSEPITDFAFSDDSTGMAVSGNKYFYKTNDFGSNWELLEYTDEERYLSPNFLYSPDNSNEFIFVYPDNVIKSTTDYGENWAYVKNYSKKFDGSLNIARAGTAKTFDNKVRVFNLFNHIEYLEYDLKPKTPEFAYELQSDKNINLDTVLTDDSKSSFIMLKNTGNALLSVEEIYFTNDYGGAYSFRDDIIDYISAGKSVAMFFDFSPEFVGGYATEIVIKFKEDVEDLVINIDAYADDASSVSYYAGIINLHPNPAKDYIEISFSNKGLQPFADSDEFAIYDVLGKKVMVNTPSLRILNGAEVRNDRHFDYAQCPVKIDISHLPSGVYFVKFGNKVEKFVKR